MKSFSFKKMKFLQATHDEHAFTMIETLVAITILTMSVAAPLTLAAKSLQAAQYSRDQIVAFNLAQEAIEVVRAQRDSNLIQIVAGNATLDWLEGVPVVEVVDVTCPQTATNPFSSGIILPCKPFRVEGGKPIEVPVGTSGPITACTSVPCPVMLFDTTNGWYNYTAGTQSRYTRTVMVRRRGAVGDPQFNEAVVRASVVWRSSIFAVDRIVTVEEEIYNWVPRN